MNVDLGHRIRIGLVQIGQCFGAQYYFPYAIGVLQSYAMANLAQPERYQFTPPVYQRMRPEDAVNMLQGQDILFFSVYLWNHELSREIARLYKKSHPEAVIVFGGPQVPEDPQRLARFMEGHPYVDIACYGEGEKPFLEIIENFGSRDWREVGNLAVRHHGGIDVNKPGTPIDDLDLIPSPYLSGVFDPLVAARPEGWSALVETNRGCPFSCAFCYWGAGKRCNLRSYGLDRVCAEIEWLSRHRIEFVFCCDANFGILPRDMEIVERVADLKTRTGFPRAFSVQSTKNSTGKIFNLQKRLNDAGLQKGVNLALQSLHLPTLEAIERSNIATGTYAELLHLFNGAGIPAFSDLILALPEESYHSFTGGVEEVIRQGQHSRIQFINLTVLENTAMAEASYIERYGLALVDSRTVSHHTSLTEESGIGENQRLVVGTSAMPGEDWVRARVFSWFVSLFYFDRLLQIPFMLLDKLAGVGVREVAEHCITQGASRPCLGNILALMQEKADGIRSGSPEYVPAPEFLDIWWPLDEYLLIRLVREGTLDRLYGEMSQLLAPFACRLPEGLLDEALRLNRALVKEPFLAAATAIDLAYAVPEMYLALQRGEEISPARSTHRYLIERGAPGWSDWESWMREMVWYGGKKGDYLFSCRAVGPERQAV